MDVVPLLVVDDRAEGDVTAGGVTHRQPVGVLGERSGVVGRDRRGAANIGDQARNQAAGARGSAQAAG